jgi:putative ABC transport system permease protein
MFLALREIRHAKVRFGLLVAAIALLVFLILAQQALQQGLITSFIGAIERQSAPVLVYSVDGQRTLQGSVITPPLQRTVEGVAGVAESGRIGQGTFTVAVNGAPQSDAALIGYERAGVGAPDRLSAGHMPRTAGEAVGSASDFSLGDTVRLAAGGGPVLRVVGLSRDAQIQVTPTLFVSWPDYVAATKAANPDAKVVLPSALGVRPAAGISPRELASRINASSPEADALTRDEAAQRSPGVKAVRGSFNLIFLLFALVVPLVTGLFFLIITLQKARALTLLRAVGAGAGALVRSLLAQVAMLTGAGVAIGTLMFIPFSQAKVGKLQLSFDGAAVLFWAVLLIALALASAIVAARRVLAIDPFEATTGGGAR